MVNSAEWLPDGINDPVVCALRRAYVERFGRFDRRGEHWVRGAIKRIERQETTVEMECRKVRNHPRLW